MARIKNRDGAQMDLQAGFQALENREIIKQLSVAGYSISDFARQLDEARVSIEEFEKAAVATNPEQLFSVTKDAVREALAHLQSLQAEKPDEALSYVFNLLKAVGRASPSVKQEVDSIEVMQGVSAKITATQKLLQSLANMQQSSQLYLDLEVAMRQAFKKVHKERKKFAAGLSKSISPQAETAQQEYASVAKTAIESQASNAYFDQLRRLGFVVYAIYEVLHLARYEAEMHPDSVVAADLTDPRKKFYELNAKRFRKGDVLQGGAVATTAAPAPIVARGPAGPGM